MKPPFFASVEMRERSGVKMKDSQMREINGHLTPFVFCFKMPRVNFLTEEQDEQDKTYCM
jgi:hypothetical protein